MHKTTCKFIAMFDPRGTPGLSKIGVGGYLCFFQQVIGGILVVGGIPVRACFIQHRVSFSVTRLLPIMCSNSEFREATLRSCLLFTEQGSMIMIPQNDVVFFQQHMTLLSVRTLMTRILLWIHNDL